MTSPRMPASAMTRSLPRPRTKWGSPRVRANRTSARSSWRVVDGREQVGRPADPHRREPGERLVARGLDPDPALDVGADRDGVERRDHGRRGRHRAPPRDSRSIAAGSGSVVRVGRRHHKLRHGVGGSRPGHRPRGGGHHHVPRRILEQGGRIEQRLGIERLVLDDPRRAGLGEHRGIGPLVAGGMRIRDDDHRQAQRGHLGQRGSAGASHDEVRGRERGQHLVAKERRTAGTEPRSGAGSASRAGERGGDMPPRP